MSSDALLADGFGEALIGLGRQYVNDVAVYDYEEAVRILIERDGMDYYEAVKFLEADVLGQWAGEASPVFITDRRRR